LLAATRNLKSSRRLNDEARNLIQLHKMIKLSEVSGIKGPDEQLSLLDGLLDRKGLMENGHQNCMKEVVKCMDALLRLPEVHAWEGISRLINFWLKHQGENCGLTMGLTIDISS
jgi:hypothetical protein